MVDREIWFQAGRKEKSEGIRTNGKCKAKALSFQKHCWCTARGRGGGGEERATGPLNQDSAGRAGARSCTAWGAARQDREGGERAGKLKFWALLG